MWLNEYQSAGASACGPSTPTLPLPYLATTAAIVPLLAKVASATTPAAFASRVKLGPSWKYMLVGVWPQTSAHTTRVTVSPGVVGTAPGDVMYSAVSA